MLTVPVMRKTGSRTERSSLCYDFRMDHPQSELVSAIEDLLNCPDLNLDELEPTTRVLIENAWRILESLRKGLKKFHVRYARVVIMETDVESQSEEDVRDSGLPGVYDGIPTDMIPSHVEDVVDHEWIWEVS